jgi:hypothetical protein
MRVYVCVMCLVNVVVVLVCACAFLFGIPCCRKELTGSFNIVNTQIIHTHTPAEKKTTTKTAAETEEGRCKDKRLLHY